MDGRKVRIKEFVFERIGPHTFKEVDLLLSGKKPAAIIHDEDDMKHLNAAILSGRLIKMRAPLIGWIVAQKKYEHYLQNMYDRLNKIKHMESMDMEEYHREMGKMLGYDQADIDFFINRERERGHL
jgi:hypothetical protein